MAQVPFSLAPLQALAARHFGVRADDPALSLEAMPGGASLRRFMRVTSPRAAGSQAPSAVGMFFPDAETPEEVSSAARSQRWPFLEVQQLLSERGVRLPALYAEDCPSGWILVEDLGDVTLAAALERDPSAKTALYSCAVRDLARAQRALDSLPPDCIVQRRSFDHALLFWELEHFREYGLEARGVYLSPAQRQRFDAAAHYLAEQITRLEYGFVHRDYQSRNLMLLGENTAEPCLAWVDFQDALLGPRAYDLVALLNDSYQSFTPEFVTQRLAEYAAERGIEPRLLPELQREFDLITVQRKLKDAGRFVFIERKKGDASYLRFFAPSLDKVRRALARLDGDAELERLALLLAELTG